MLSILTIFATFWNCLDFKQRKCLHRIFYIDDPTKHLYLINEINKNLSLKTFQLFLTEYKLKKLMKCIKVLFFFNVKL